MRFVGKSLRKERLTCDWSVQCTGWHVKVEEAWRWESVQCSDSAADGAAVRSIKDSATELRPLPKLQLVHTRTRTRRADTLLRMEARVTTGDITTIGYGICYWGIPRCSARRALAVALAMQRCRDGGGDDGGGEKGKRHFLLRRWLDHLEYSPAEGTGPIAWCAMR